MLHQHKSNVSPVNWRKFKTVVNGDPSQIDLINRSHSGLVSSRKILSKEIKIIEFSHKDVVRHPLVSKIIKAYQKSLDDKVDVIVQNNKWKKSSQKASLLFKRKVLALNKKEKFIKEKKLAFL